MDVLVALEHRFSKTADGAVWTQTMFGLSFWCRYLDAFDGVKILARAKEVTSVPDDWERVDGPGITFLPVPHYVGPEQFLLRALPVLRTTRAAINAVDAVILRVPSRIAAIIHPVLLRTGHPYGVEVVGDPYDVFAPGNVKHPLRPFFRWWFPRELRYQCYRACAAAYVTKSSLQRRYPPSPETFTTHYSDVELPTEAFVSSPRTQFNSDLPTIIFVGTLQQLYKGPDVLINALGRCIKEGLNSRLIIVGDGQYRAKLRVQAVNLGIADRVIFTGQLSKGSAVREELDRADLFVLPSLTEGLPRAMIEAMARGLPCIGSTVGGITELLPPEDMVPPGNADALALKILEVIRDPQRMANMSRRNLEKAYEYRDEALRKRRLEFYQYMRKTTESWVKSRTSPWYDDGLGSQSQL